MDLASKNPVPLTFELLESLPSYHILSKLFVFPHQGLFLQRRKGTSPALPSEQALLKVVCYLSEELDIPSNDALVLAFAIYSVSELNHGSGSATTGDEFPINSRMVYSPMLDFMNIHLNTALEPSTGLASISDRYDDGLDGVAESAQFQDRIMAIPDVYSRVRRAIAEQSIIPTRGSGYDDDSDDASSRSSFSRSSWSYRGRTDSSDSYSFSSCSSRSRSRSPDSSSSSSGSQSRSRSRTRFRCPPAPAQPMPKTVATFPLDLGFRLGLKADTRLKQMSHGDTIADSFSLGWAIVALGVMTDATQLSNPDVAGLRRYITTATAEFTRIGGATFDVGLGQHRMLSNLGKNLLALNHGVRGQQIRAGVAALVQVGRTLTAEHVKKHGQAEIEKRSDLFGCQKIGRMFANSLDRVVGTDMNGMNGPKAANNPFTQGDDFIPLW